LKAFMECLAVHHLEQEADDWPLLF
jgi:hypothetical protein